MELMVSTSVGEATTFAVVRVIAEGDVKANNISRSSVFVSY